jgi:hypothetical protein
MKARIKETGEIVEVHDCSNDMYVEKFGELSGRLFHITELDFDNLESPDYWTRLEHQYAGMAMNALLLTNNIRNGDLEGMRECNTNAMAIAYALVEKLKESKI